METWWNAQNQDEVYLICAFDWSVNGITLPFSTAVDGYYGEFGNGYVPFFAVIGAYNVLMYGDNTYTGSIAMIPDAVASFANMGVLEPIANQSMYYNETLELDIEDMFGHPGDEDITVTVSNNSDESVATAELVGNTLTITSLAATGDTDITLTATGGTLSVDFTFNVSVMSADDRYVVIYDLDTTPTGSVLKPSIEASYTTGEVYITDDLGAYPLANADAVFVLLGIYSNNAVIDEAAAGVLATYLDGGGNVYMEGGDTWAYDAATSVHPYFGINGDADGSSDLSAVNGLDFMSGMSWTYGGENSYIDQLSTIGTAVSIFENAGTSNICGIANTNGVYRTVGTSFEITGLAGTNTMDEAVFGIMNYFMGEMPEQGTINGTVTLVNGSGSITDVVVAAGSQTANPAADGTYTLALFPGTYTVTATLDSYEDAVVADVVVTESTDTDGIDLALTYIPDDIVAPEGVEVTPAGLVTWGGDEVEFRYDDGIATAQLGFGDNPYSVMGGSHFYNAVVTEVTWLLTSNAVHTEAVLYIFGLDAAGIPDTGQLLHESAAQPNVDDSWNTYVLPTPVNAPNGFFVGVCTPNIFTAIGTDDGVGEPYVFEEGTQMGIADWTAGNDWLDVGPAGFPFNFTVRAMGQNLGEVRYTEEAPVVDYSNTGLVYSELDTPIAPATRDFIEFNVYLNGVLQGSTTAMEYQLTGLVNGTEYTAAVSSVYDDGESELVEVIFTADGADGENFEIPTVNSLVGNYPNPFNPTTSIKFATVESGHVTLEVFNTKGQKVKTLVNETMSADSHIIDWNGTDDSGKAVSSGIYFYKMRTNSYNETKKMVLMK